MLLAGMGLNTIIDCSSNLRSWDMNQTMIGLMILDNDIWI